MIKIEKHISVEDIEPNMSLTKAIARILELKDGIEMLDNHIKLDNKLAEKGIMLNIKENKADLKSIERKKKIMSLKIILSSIILDNTKYISNRQRTYKSYKKY